MIKEINRSEIPKCVELIKQSFLTVADELGFNEMNAPKFIAFSINKDKLYRHYDNGDRKMYAYYIDKNIVGYYSLLCGENGYCELNNLCVKPEYRHKKIGDELLKHCILNAKKLGYVKINIGIVEENTKLRKWYECHGFKHINTAKFDFFPFTCGYMDFSYHSY